MLKYTIIALALISTALSLKCQVQKTYMKDGDESKECTKELATALNEALKTMPDFASKETGDFVCLNSTVRFDENKEFSNIRGCGFKDTSYCKLKDDVEYTKKFVKDCKTCTEDGCNPAARPVVSLGVMVFLGLAAVLAKFH